MKIKIKNILLDLLCTNSGYKKLENQSTNCFPTINTKALSNVCQTQILRQTFIQKICAVSLLIFFAFTSFATCCHGQGVNIPRSLNIGDTLSRSDLATIFQASNLPKNRKTLALNNYKDDLIILDFMNSSCSGCIAAIPKLDSLKNKFDKLKVFMVSSEKIERSLYFFQHNEIARKTKIPMIYGDTILKKLFPHMFISHLVWIKNAKVLAITRTKEVNQENINKVVVGEKINFPIKNDFIKSVKNE